MLGKPLMTAFFQWAMAERLVSCAPPGDHFLMSDFS